MLGKLSVTVFAPGETLIDLVALRVGEVATSTMQATPPGAKNTALMRASENWIAFCPEPLQPHASASAASAARERIVIFGSPFW